MKDLEHQIRYCTRQLVIMPKFDLSVRNVKVDFYDQGQHKYSQLYTNHVEAWVAGEYWKKSISNARTYKLR